jgi:hypothetical protein
MNAPVNHWPQLSRPLEGAKLVVISHGGGVQTTAMCLMAALGEITPMPDLAIFADTGGELRRTYDLLDWLQAQVPFPIVRVRRPGPSLGDTMLQVASGKRRREKTPLVPFYALAADGERSMLPKQCSKDYKTRVVAREIARRLGIGDGKRGPRTPAVELWIGMTRDEMMRVATNERKWIHNRHPLVELNMHRRDVVRWFERRGFPLPTKSSCIFCPFRDNPAWARMKSEDPADFDRACQFDDAVRAGWPGIDGKVFIHRNFEPLRDAVLTEPDPQLDFFTDCESCGI